MPATARSGWRQHMQQIWLGRGPLAWLLRPIAGLYGLLVRLRRWLYAAGLQPIEHAGVPVIVVGNVIAGGAGKTPVVMALVRHLQSRGFQPGVVSRGYGRDTRDCREVQPTDVPQQVGDEPLLIRQRTAAPVFVAQRRIDAARALLTRYPDTQIIVCDDGLQHLALARDLEICVFDDRGTGNGWLLPAGPLREPWPRPVDLVLHTGSRPAFAGHTAQRALSRVCRQADGQTGELASLAQSPAPLLAVAGIANPQSFFDMLRAAGLTLAATQALPDHHDYADWHPPAGGPYTVLCTEKDAAKLWPRCPQAWTIALELTPEPDFFADIDRQLARMTSTPLSSPHGHPTT